MSDAVVIFDRAGRLAYANRAGREAVESLDATGDGARVLMPQLALLGARIAPIWVGGAKLGEAVYVPPRDQVGRTTLAERERQAIVQTLEATGWKLTESARRLGISRTTLWRRLRAYGLEREHRGRWSKRP